MFSHLRAHAFARSVTVARSSGYIDNVTGTLRFGIFLTIILKTLPERCFFVQFLTVILKTLPERCFFVQCLTVILIALRER